MSARDDVIENAARVINGPRREAHGDVGESFGRIAAGWAQILGHEVTSRDVALMMIWLKVVREANAHQSDNIVDIVGYAALAAEL